MGKTFQEIIIQDKPVLVDFFATWCGPCQMQGPILDGVKQEIGDQADIIKIDVDKNQALAAQLGIRSVPTLILYKKGEVVWRYSGVAQHDELLNLLSSNVS